MISTRKHKALQHHSNFTVLGASIYRGRIAETRNTDSSIMLHAATTRVNPFQSWAAVKQVFILKSSFKVIKSHNSYFRQTTISKSNHNCWFQLIKKRIKNPEACLIPPRITSQNWYLFIRSNHVCTSNPSSGELLRV
jgi:hypothetical protein